jgi:hypothetical protein
MYVSDIRFMTHEEQLAIAVFLMSRVYCNRSRAFPKRIFVRARDVIFMKQPGVVLPYTHILLDEEEVSEPEPEIYVPSVHDMRNIISEKIYHVSNFGLVSMNDLFRRNMEEHIQNWRIDEYLASKQFLGEDKQLNLFYNPNVQRRRPTQYTVECKKILIK